MRRPHKLKMDQKHIFRHHALLSILQVMVFQPTSPVKSFAVVQRAATVTKKPKAEPSTMGSTAGSSKGDMAHSDSVPSDLSQADTQRNSQLSAYTANTGGRARSSWGRMSRFIQKSSEALRTENKLTKPNPHSAPAATDDSPTAPEYDEVTKTFRAELPARERIFTEKRASKETTKSPIDDTLKSFKTRSPKIQMPPIAVTGPDEPRSFLDLDSSDDEGSPVIQRASSVRVAKPQIVRHNSTSAGRTPKIGNSQSEATMDKSGQLLGQDLKHLRDLTQDDSSESAGGPADALKMLEGTESVDSSTVALPPTPPSRSLTPEDSIKETVVNVPGPAAGVTESITLTPDTGIKSQEAEIVAASSKRSSTSGTPSFNPLRANPLSDLDREHTRLARTMSAPLPPNRNPNRRVTIRPTDLVINHNDSDHRMFRESVVTTPYPNRLSMVNEGAENRLFKALDEKRDLNNKLTALPDFSTIPAIKPVPQISTSITPHPIEKTGDRFPSPSQTEHLFLTLSLPSPTTATANSQFSVSPSTTIEIDITDRATFDDEALFTVIRKSYLCNLLGSKRRLFFSRVLSHAVPGSQDMHLDAPSFIAHLTCPKLGRNKKGWLIWLRNQQPLPKRASSMFSGHSPDHERGHHHSSSNVSAYWSPTPTSNLNGNGNGIPRMPFSRIQSRDLLPRVILYYRFNVLAISLALFLVEVLSMLSTVLWVLFGVPGQQAGEEAKETIFGTVGWKREAEFRVLTGLVLGIVASLLGMGGVALWCAGGWVLL